MRPSLHSQVMCVLILTIDIVMYHDIERYYQRAAGALHGEQHSS